MNLPQNIVLDNSVIGNWGFKEGKYFEELLRQKQLGRTISLADLAVVEIAPVLNIKSFDADLLANRLSQIISPDIPIWPGKKDLFSQNVQLESDIRKAGYAALIQCLRQKKWSRKIVRIGSAKYTVENNMHESERLRDKENKEWTTLLNNIVGMKDLKYDELWPVIAGNVAREFPDVPGIQNGLDYYIKKIAMYVVEVGKGSINYKHDKRKNDGIDLNLDMSLYHPCVIVSNDKRYVSWRDKVADSPQAAWVKFPSEL